MTGDTAPARRMTRYLDDNRTSPRWPTLLNLVQRVATTSGRNHAVGETTEWLKEAGFEHIAHLRFSAWNLNSCLVGHRAGVGEPR